MRRENNVIVDVDIEKENKREKMRARERDTNSAKQFGRWTMQM